MFRPKQIFNFMAFAIRRISLVLVFTIFSTSVSYIYTYTRTLAPEHAYAATSSNLNYQARLLNANGSTVPDGFYNLRFNLYSAASGGASLWNEEYYDSNGVTAGNDNRVRVVNGYLSVNLASQTAFPALNWDQDMWLTMNVGGSAQSATPTYDGEMSPRVKLTAVPYAFQAKQSETLVKTAGGFTGTVDFAALTADRRYLLPDTSLATTASPGTICVFNGAASNCPAASGSAYYIQNDTVLQTQSNYNIQARDSGANGTIGAQIRGAANGQTVDLFRLLATDGTVLTAFQADGKLAFGPSGSQDTNLYRSAANTLMTDDNFIVGSQKLEVSVAGNYVYANAGYLELGTAATGKNALRISSTSADTGITIGGDTNLYRSAANTLMTDDALTVAGLVTGQAGLTVTGGASSLSGGIISLNGSSNFATNINTGTSTGAVNIGNGAAGAISLTSGSTIALSGTNVNLTTAGQLQLPTVGSSGGIILGGDASLYRQAADYLRTTATFDILQTSASAFAVREATGGVASLLVNTTSNTVNINNGADLSGYSGDFGSQTFNLDAANGSAQLGSSVTTSGVLNVGTNTTTAAGGIYLGTDTTLYRSGADTLRTDDDFVAARFFQTGSATSTTALNIKVTGDTTCRFCVNSDGFINWGNGTTLDTTLYRSAANTLATDDSFSLLGTGSNLTVQGTGTSSFAGSIDVTGSVAFKQGTDFSTVGTTNNANFGEASLIRLTGASAQTITGIANGRDGEILTIVNAAAQTAIISNNSGSSTAVNRITTGTGSDLTLAVGGSITLIYDNGASLWRVTGSAAGGSVSTVGAIDSQTKSANGAVITGSSIYLQTADATNVGVVSIGAQTFAGDKTFAGDIQIQGGDLTTNQATFNLLNSTATTINLGGAATALNVGATGSALTIQAGNALNIYSATTGSLTLDSGTTGAINIGTNANAKAIAIGNTTGATSLTLNSGTGNIDIGTTAQARSTNIATGAAVQTVTLGSTSGASSLTFNAGTGNIDIGTTGQARSLNFGTGAAAQTIVIGSTNSTSSLTFNSGTGNIDIGTTAQARATNIATGGAVQTVAIGSVSGASSLTLNSGTGNIDVGTTAQARTLNFGTGSADQTVVIGSTNTTSGTTVQGGTDGLTNTTSGQLTLQSSQASANAVRINSSDTAGGIDIDAGTAGVTIDSTGAISLDSTAIASNFGITANSASNAVLTLSSANAGVGDGIITLTADQTINLNAGTIVGTATTQNLFNTVATTINFGGAATLLNIGPTGNGASSIVLSGGSADTGCTVDGATGNLACSGNITGNAAGTVGYFSRSGTTLQPATAGDNIQTTSSGTITSAGLLTGQLGLTVTGATVNLNASSNFATNINTGTSTGAVAIGNSSAGVITLQSGTASAGIGLNAAGGNVGIGTNAPAYKLDVASTFSTADTGSIGARIVQTDSGTTANGVTKQGLLIDATYSGSATNGIGIGPTIRGLQSNTTYSGALAGSDLQLSLSAGYFNPTYSGGAPTSSRAVYVSGIEVNNVSNLGTFGSKYGERIIVSGTASDHTGLGITVGGATSNTGISTGVTSSSSVIGTEYGSTTSINDFGVVTSGTDTTYGSRIIAQRTAATGGIINTYGLDIQASGDNAGAGTSTVTGLRVDTSASTADTTIAAQIFGGRIDLNASSNFATNINTGTSTGAVSIGNGAAGAISLTSGSTIALSGTNVNLTTAGQLQLPTVGSSGGIILGGDATLYREAAEHLRTTSTFDILKTNSVAFAVRGSGSGIATLLVNTNVNSVNINNGADLVGFSGDLTAQTFLLDAATGSAQLGSSVTTSGVLNIGTNTTTAAGGIYLGTDTNLYRSAANVLKTDDALHVQSPNASGPQESLRLIDGGLGSNEGGYIRFDTGDKTDQGRIGLESNTTTNGSELYFSTNAIDTGTPTERLRIQSNGSITIGTATATTGATAGMATLYGTGTNGASARLFFGDGDNTTNQNVFVGEQGSGDSDILQLHGKLGLQVTTGANAADVNFSLSGTGAATFQNTSNSVTAFRILTAGGTPTTLFNADTTNTRIGIGTATPESRLHVSGGRILLDNDFSIRFKDSGGTARDVFGYSSANNTQVLNRAATGSIQIENVNDTGSIQLRAGASSQMRLEIEGDGDIITGSGTTYTNTASTRTHMLIQPTMAPAVSSTSAFIATSIAPTINYAAGGAGSVTALLINPTWTAVPTGNLRLIDLQNGGTSVFNVSRVGNTTLKTTTDGIGLLIQNNANAQIFSVDTANTRITIGTGAGTLATRNLDVAIAEVTSIIRVGTSTNGISFNDTGSDEGAASKFRLSGTARNSVSTTLIPEYSGATMTGDGALNTGTMTSDFCSGTSRRSINTTVCGSTDEHNYYSWTAQATNDYDVWARWQVPSDFDGWDTTAIQFYGHRSSNSAGTSVTLTLYNAAGTACGTATPITNTTTWSLTTYNATGMCTPTPGEIMTFRVTMSVGVNNEFARMGAITINYLSRF